MLPARPPPPAPRRSSRAANVAAPATCPVRALYARSSSSPSPPRSRASYIFGGSVTRSDSWNWNPIVAPAGIFTAGPLVTNWRVVAVPPPTPAPMAAPLPPPMRPPTAAPSPVPTTMRRVDCYRATHRCSPPSCCASAPPGVDLDLLAAEGLHSEAEFHVSQLADEEVARRLLGPSEEDVAGRLHASVAVHDTLALVGKHALAGVRLQHRGARLLDLEKERVAVAGREQEDVARRPDTADPDHLHGGIAEPVAVQQRLVGRGQRRTIRGERVRHRLPDLAGRHVLGGKIVGS